ncbi:peptidase M14 [Filobacillus milosensis]|uniref:Peptidase M14 n=1 Tax=Filobacillus milosensis TaxID=94137 RepID=A0A4Y8ITV9_9BACI|nr:M14 family zinc carboxypeptidase [Filobacillus milosensis]TFB24479.1 peptidase M14 [Filobacillus milosensis]
MKVNIKWLALGMVVSGALLVGMLMIRSQPADNLQSYEYNMKPKSSLVSSVAILSESDVITTEPIVNPRQVYTYENMVEDIYRLTDRYNGLVTNEVIGESVDGRDIYAVRLGYGEREIFIHAATHAREWITTNLVMNQIDSYSAAFVNSEKVDGFDVRELLQKVSIYYVPMVNPDGVTLVQKGADALSNSEYLLKIHDGNPDFSRWKANANGVDLNRNYSVGWEQAHADTGEPGFQNYKGPSPMSEPETQAIAAFVKNHNFELALAYHTSGELVYWGKNLPEDLEDVSYELATVFGEETGYPLHRGGSGGMFSDWFAHEIGAPNLTPEIAPYAGPGPVPLENYNRIWQQNFSMGLLMADYILEDTKK